MSRPSRAGSLPAPRVDGGLLVFRRRAEPLVPTELASSYRRFVAGGFRRGLRAVASARALRGVGGRSALGRDLDAHQWAELFKRIDM
jgi:hypothetical protein